MYICINVKFYFPTEPVHFTGMTVMQNCRFKLNFLNNVNLNNTISMLQYGEHGTTTRVYLLPSLLVYANYNFTYNLPRNLPPPSPHLGIDIIWEIINVLYNKLNTAYIELYKMFNISKYTKSSQLRLLYILYILHILLYFYTYSSNGIHDCIKYQIQRNFHILLLYIETNRGCSVSSKLYKKNPSTIIV